MRWLMWYIRSIFCNHNWNYDERDYVKVEKYDDGEKFTQRGLKVSATCNTCGWHRNYWKHN